MAYQVGGRVSGFDTRLLHVRDEKAAGTAGGSFSSGSWVKRTLNTVKTNEIAGASLASDQITLPAGTYHIEAQAVASQVDQHILKLRNVTDGADVIIGSVAHSSNSDVVSSPSFVRGRFTITAQKIFELQHRCQTTDSGGLGPGITDMGVVHVFAEVKIWRVR